MKLFIYIHLSQEMKAKCNSSDVQENLNNSNLGNSEYHIIHSMMFLSITYRILVTNSCIVQNFLKQLFTEICVVLFVP
jgi:hypothetical protein